MDSLLPGRNAPRLRPVRAGAGSRSPIARRSGREATIKVTNLRLRAFVGFNPEERQKQQDVIINLQIRHRTKPGIFDDVVDDALNYKTITKAIIRHVENGRFLLLEKLVGDVLDLCTDNEATTWARVTIDKPHALRFSDSVSVTMEYENPDNNR